MSEAQLKEAQAMAKKVTDALGGYGLFGVELSLHEIKYISVKSLPAPMTQEW